MVKIKHNVIALLLLIPALFFGLFFISLFNPNLFLQLDPTGDITITSVTYVLIESILLCLMTAVHFLFPKTKQKIIHKINTFYMNFEPFILISVAIAVSLVLAYLLEALISTTLYKQIGPVNPKIIAILSFSLVGISLFYSKKIRVLQLLMAVALLATSVIFGLFAYMTYQWMQPQFYTDFPLNDKTGRYIINYDGDYWITYYGVKIICNDKGQYCHEELEKKGNTAITSSPVDLAPYRDKNVIVTGTFKKIRREIYPGEKELCIGTGLTKDCKKTIGPGTWYYSPLIIDTIQLEK
jgi:hypothetical protein